MPLHTFLAVRGLVFDGLGWVGGFLCVLDGYIVFFFWVAGRHH